MKSMILTTILMLMIVSISSAQKVSQSQFFELTERDSALNENFEMIFHERFIIIESKTVNINSDIKRRKRKKDNSIEFYMKDKSRLRIYKDMRRQIESIFIYKDSRVFFVSI